MIGNVPLSALTIMIKEKIGKKKKLKKWNLYIDTDVLVF
jgi:hypothetical protein